MPLDRALARALSQNAAVDGGLGQGRLDVAHRNAVAPPADFAEQKLARAIQMARPRRLFGRMRHLGGGEQRAGVKQADNLQADQGKHYSNRF